MWNVLSTWVTKHSDQAQAVGFLASIATIVTLVFTVPWPFKRKNPHSRMGPDHASSNSFTQTAITRGKQQQAGRDIIVNHHHHYIFVCACLFLIVIVLYNKIYAHGYSVANHDFTISNNSNYAIEAVYIYAWNNNNLENLLGNHELDQASSMSFTVTEGCKKDLLIVFNNGDSFKKGSFDTCDNTHYYIYDTEIHGHDFTITSTKRRIDEVYISSLDNNSDRDTGWRLPFDKSVASQENSYNSYQGSGNSRTFHVKGCEETILLVDADEHETERSLNTCKILGVDAPD
jgi:hypothetical protein